jgi:sporulation protein YlmC with PRC-barrel domain
MKILLVTATAVALALGASASTVKAADIKEQPIALVQVDVQGVMNGYRASKLLGTAVRNDNKESIGTVNDLLVSRNDKVLYAVVDVGSFLGIGGKLVVIPYDSIQVQQDGDHQILVIPGATKDALKSLPKFEYAK